MRPALILSLILALTSTVSAADMNWPQFRGPGGEGQVASTKIPLEWSESKNITWKTSIHDRGWSSPVVWGNQVWLTTATKDGKQMYALCVDFETGKILHDLLIFENDQVSEIHTLNGYASPTPVIEEGRVYVHFGSYGTACLDTQTGKVLWQRRDLPCEHFRGPGSSPILFGNLLIMHYDGFDYQYAIALDKQTGETVWKTDRKIDYGTDNGDFKKAFCTPLVIDVDGQLQLISPTSKASLALDPMTGKELWRIHYKEFSATARPLYAHGLVYINTGFGKAQLYAVRPGQGDVTDSNVVWKATKSVGSKPSSVIVGDLLFMVHDAGVASCLDAKTGEEVWSKRLGGNYSASLIAAGDRVYFFSQEGKTTVVKADREYQELAVNELGADESEGFMASPAVVGDTLLLRTHNHLYRIDADQ